MSARKDGSLQEDFSYPTTGSPSDRVGLLEKLQRYEGCAPGDSQHDVGHTIERDVQRHLLVDSDFHISSLVVHRIPDGICLEGTLWAVNDKDNLKEVSQEAMRVAGVKQVLNHLVLHEPDNATKGPASLA